MRYVQFAKDFRQHFGKVVVVADVWQEAPVVLYHCRPVTAVVVGAENLLFNLACHMAEHVFPFCGKVELHVCGEGDGFQRIALAVDFFHSVAAERIEISVLVHFEVRIPGVGLRDEFGLPFAQVHLPEVHAAFKGGKVIEVFAVLAEDGVAKVAGVGRKAYNAVADAVEVDVERLGSLRFVLLLTFFFAFAFSLGILFVVLCLFLVLLVVLLFHLLEQGVVFGREAVAVVGILGEECKQYVVLTAP